MTDNTADPDTIKISFPDTGTDQNRMTVRDDNVIHEAAEALKLLERGWYKYSHIHELFREHGIGFSQGQMPTICERVTEETDVRISRSCGSGGNGVRYFVESGSCPEDHYREYVPDGWMDAFKHCIQYGRRPSVSAATVMYLESLKSDEEPLTQTKAAKKTGVTPVSVRSSRDFIEQAVENGELEVPEDAVFNRYEA